MRLFELTMPETAADVDHLLLSKGWDKVGSGNYADVYSKPGIGYVLKVFERDSAYMEYLSLIKSQSNPHFPRVKGMIWFRDHNARYNAVRLEKLDPCREVEVDGVMSDNLSGMLNAYLIAGGFDETALRNQFQQENLRQAKAYLADKPDFIKALDLIASTRRMHNLYYDVSPYNIMFRGDTPVIIDPYYA